MRFNKKIVSRSKCTQLLQLNKQLKISLLDITRKKNQSVFFNCHRIVTKNWDLTEWLSSYLLHYAIFFILYYPLFLIIRKISVVFTFILTLRFFFFFWKILILLATIFSFLAFSSSERFWYLLHVSFQSCSLFFPILFDFLYTLIFKFKM